MGDGSCSGLPRASNYHPITAFYLCAPTARTCLWEQELRNMHEFAKESDATILTCHLPQPHERGVSRHLSWGDSATRTVDQAAATDLPHPEPEPN